MTPRDARPPRAARALALALASVLVLAACTGTVTPSLPTLLVVARDGTPATLALVAVDLSPTGRALRLVTASAHAFEAGTALLALDALPRSGVPSEAWVLLADAAGAVGLERFDLSDVPDDAGAIVPRLGARVALTTSTGSWAPELTPGAYLGPVCPRQIVVGGPSSAPRRYVAVWDRCPAEPSGDGRVHVVDLEEARVASWAQPAPYDDVGVRPGVSDPATFTTVSVAVGEARRVETRALAAPENPVASAPLAAADETLLDLAVARDAWWALVRPSGGDPVVRASAPDAATSTRAALANATRLVVGGGPGVLTASASQVQVVFADATSPAVALAAVGVGAAPAAVGATVEANDYAVVATTGGTLCALDARVPATQAGCEFVLSTPLAGARFLTWTYASAP